MKASQGFEMFGSTWFEVKDNLPQYMSVFLHRSRWNGVGRCYKPPSTTAEVSVELFQGTDPVFAVVASKHSHHFVSLV